MSNSMVEDHAKAAEYANVPEHVRDKLTLTRNDESQMIAAIIRREILYSGKFADKLADYAHAYARTDKVDSVHASQIIRSQFTALYGVEMNDFRKQLMEREQSLSPEQRSQGLEAAERIVEGVRQGQAFWKQYDVHAKRLADHLSITESGAKAIIKDEFEREKSREFYSFAKEVERDRQAPEASSQQAVSQSPSMKRDGPKPTR